MIAIVDYGVGNIRSVKNALMRAGASEPVYTQDEDLLRAADKVILPGVGDASFAMAELKKRNLDAVIPTLTQPVLGICVGMQLMCSFSEEGNTECMSIFHTRVVRFSPALEVKIPHIGWNTVTGMKSPLFEGVEEGSYFYYVHSYYPEISSETIGTTCHGVTFSGALAVGNFYGTQFHPEKSGAVGMLLLQNFLKL